MKQQPKINYFVSTVRKRKRIDDEEKEEVIIPNKRNQIEIPEHMLYDILLNLPAKSLMRFKCLSKECNSVISSHRFQRHHLQHNVISPNKYSLIIHQEGFLEYALYYYKRRQQREGPEFRGVTLVDYDSLQRVAAAAAVASEHQQQNLQQVSSKKLSFSDFLPSKWEPFKVTCCCDGILCIALCSCLFLLNPLTSDYKRLPFPDPDCQFDPIYPVKTWEAFGIGYDSSIDDYKLVRVPSFSYYGVKNSSVYVMNLKSNSWRKIYMDFPYAVNVGEESISADGHLYWLAKSLQTNNYVLIGFDLAKETFSEVPMPPNENNVEELGLLGGFISLTISNERNDCFDIWMMKGQTWIKFLSFPLSTYKGTSSIRRLRPLFFNQDGALVMEASLSFEGYVGLIYDSKAGTCKLFQVPGRWGQVFVYTQSTVSLSY